MPMVWPRHCTLSSWPCSSFPIFNSTGTPIDCVDLNVIELFRKHIRLQGSHYASKIEVAHVLGLVASGELAPVIHQTYPLSDVQAAATAIAERSAFGKLVLIP